MKTIEIIVSPEGSTRIATTGYTGSECREATRFLETALGVRAAETLTAEFHQTHMQDSTHLQQET